MTAQGWPAAASVAMCSHPTFEDVMEGHVFVLGLESELFPPLEARLHVDDALQYVLSGYPPGGRIHPKPDTWPSPDRRAAEAEEANTTQRHRGGI